MRVTGGRIDDLLSSPRGHLDAKLEGQSLDGIAAIVGRFAPDSPTLGWLQRAAPDLTPAVLNARVVAPPRAGASGVRISVDGVAGSTTLQAAA